MKSLTELLLDELDAVVTIRATAPGYVFAELVREDRDPLTSEGSDVGDALDGLERKASDELYEAKVSR